MQRRIVAELEGLATCKDIPPLSRAHAAMTLSECYTIGFGADHDVQRVLQWLEKAANEGMHRALRWYPRIWRTIGNHEPLDCSSALGEKLEEELKALPPTHYLPARIRAAANIHWELARTDIAMISKSEPSPAHPTPEGRPINVKLFNPWIVDEISTLHFLAWTGQVGRLEPLLSPSTVDLPSTLGFTPAHYACMGGHLSVLDVLIKKGASVREDRFRGITPLHLCIFMDDTDTHDAVSLLVGPNATVEIFETGPELNWEDHNIILRGTPLDWAVLTRHSSLVKALLPHFNGSSCVQLALDCFFWDILELLLDDLAKKGIAPPAVNIPVVQRPFNYWIAHGKDHAGAVSQTLSVMRTRKLEMAADPYGTPVLTGYTTTAKTVMDLEMLYQVTQSSPPATIKEVTHISEDPLETQTTLSVALSRCGHYESWAPVIRLLLDSYSVQELETEVKMGYAYLHLAVVHDSYVGVRELLRKGVDANQVCIGDLLRHTPMHMCLGSGSPLDIYKLLLENGASMELRDGLMRLTPFTNALWVPESLALVKEALNYTWSEATYIEIINEVVMCTSNSREWLTTYKNLDTLRFVISHDVVGKYINHLAPDGTTPLQKAIIMMHAETLGLLLEAGADASVSFEGRSGRRVLPLESACEAGRLLWMGYPNGQVKPFPTEQRKDAMSLAVQLLDWHHARNDGLFVRITPLHIASFMCSAPEVSRLVLKGADCFALGQWPGIDHEVTPKELMELGHDGIAQDALLIDRDHLDSVAELNSNKDTTWGNSRSVKLLLSGEWTPAP